MARAFPWTSPDSLRSGLLPRVAEWETFESLRIIGREVSCPQLLPGRLYSWSHLRIFCHFLQWAFLIGCFCGIWDTLSIFP